jgi:Spy/CpxP family protein refolding chaperone
MLKISRKIFGTVIASLLVASPVFAADSGVVTSVDNGGVVNIAERGQDRPGRMEGRGRMEGPQGKFCGKGEMFKFSDSQLEKMSSIKNQYLDKSSAQSAELGNLHRQLKDVLSQTSIDRSKAEAIQTKINSLKSELSISRLNMKIDEMGVLTPEQREQIHHRMLLGEAFGGRGGHHQHFGGGKHFEHGGRPDRT